MLQNENENQTCIEDYLNLQDILAFNSYYQFHQQIQKRMFVTIYDKSFNLRQLPKFYVEKRKIKKQHSQRREKSNNGQFVKKIDNQHSEVIKTIKSKVQKIVIKSQSLIKNEEDSKNRVYNKQNNDVNQTGSVASSKRKIFPKQSLLDPNKASTPTKLSKLNPPKVNQSNDSWKVAQTSQKQYQKSSKNNINYLQQFTNKTQYNRSKVIKINLQQFTHDNINKSKINQSQKSKFSRSKKHKIQKIQVINQVNIKPDKSEQKIEIKQIKHIKQDICNKLQEHNERDMQKSSVRSFKNINKDQQPKNYQQLQQINKSKSKTKTKKIKQSVIFSKKPKKFTQQIQKNNKKIQIQINLQELSQDQPKSSKLRNQKQIQTKIQIFHQKGSNKQLPKKISTIKNEEYVPTQYCEQQLYKLQVQKNKNQEYDYNQEQINQNHKIDDPNVVSYKIDLTKNHDKGQNYQDKDKSFQNRINDKTSSMIALPLSHNSNIEDQSPDTTIIYQAFPQHQPSNKPVKIDIQAQKNHETKMQQNMNNRDREKQQKTLTKTARKKIFSHGLSSNNPNIQREVDEQNFTVEEMKMLLSAKGNKYKQAIILQYIKQNRATKS